MAHNPPAGGEGHISRDKDTIREWADRHNVVPVQESGTGESSRRFRMVPEDQMSETQERLEWEEFHDQLQEGDHAVIYHGEEAEEPFEIAGHEEISTRVDDEDIRDRLVEGETVTSEITETTVVETVVVEETDIESELVDTTVVDQHIADVELLNRECTDCTIVEDGTVDARNQFDADRYFSALDGTTSESMGSTAVDVDDLSYHPEIELKETWAVMRELVEEFTIESRITGTEVTEADSVEEHDIDVQGLHRSIVESGLIKDDRAPDEILADCEINTEVAESDRVHTTFTRERMVEDEVTDRKHLTTDITAVELLEMKTIRSREIVSEEETVGEEELVGEEEPMGEEVTTRETSTVNLTDDIIGHTVVNASGEKVGMVSAVEANQNRIDVDVHPGIADRISAALGWGSADEEDYTLRAEQIRRVTDDTVELRSEEHLSNAEHDR